MANSLEGRSCLVLQGLIQEEPIPASQRAGNSTLSAMRETSFSSSKVLKLG